METVTSSDSTTIAFDRLGDGPPVIVVGGQLCDRALTRPTAEVLAKRFTVFNYDRRGRGDIGRGGAVPTDLAGRVRCETLVLVGGASPEWMIDVARQVAEAMPYGRYRVLEGQEHVVPPEILVPVVAEFLAG